MQINCKFFLFNPQSSDLSVFETNIRFVGGLLSAYALTGDQVSNRTVDNHCIARFVFNSPLRTRCGAKARVGAMTMYFGKWIFLDEKKIKSNLKF